MRRRAATIGVVTALAALATRAGEPAPDVLVLVSANLPAYRQAEEGLRRALARAAPAPRVASVLLDAPDGESLAQLALRGEPALIAVIGSRAVRLARESPTPRPLVYAMVLDPESVGLPASAGPRADPLPVTGVSMDVTPDRQFELLKNLVPGVRRIGVIYDPAVSGEAVRQAAAASHLLGLTLVPQAVRGEGEVLAAARLLAPQVDAFWAVADPTVLTAANARALILHCLRARKPLVALSEGYVRSGALAALAADPLQVGLRAGELARRVLSGERPADLRPEPPPRLAVFLNRATAEHLGLSLPPAVLARADAIYPP
ncbi:MAG TPA: ABC transporter substrate binding protein [Candidatus Polarisedimenticolaceae bacterium]|nr:ABC transporter substrate binding protein [Candidatus Polarisedimenticolaceae bacterium]